MQRYWVFRSILLALAVVLSAAPAAWPQTATELNAIGVEHYNAREWAEAIKSFGRAAQLDPAVDIIRTNLSNAHQAHAGDLATQGHYGEAIRELESVLLLDAENAQPLIQLGAYYLHEGFVTDAIHRLEEAIALAPDDVDAHFLLGEAYYKDNDASSALDQWEWVFRVDPGRPDLAKRMKSATREERVEADFSNRSSRHFNVTYDREAEGALVREILGVLENAYRDVGRTLGRAYPPTPIQISLYTVQGFSESTQVDEHVGALYDGTKIRCPVIDAEGRRLPADELRRRLYHEYVHVVVNYLAKDTVPWWLNEGLAESLSREMGDREFRFLRSARQQDALFHLSDLSGAQLGQHESAALSVAYRQSHATVDFLKRRFGVRRFVTLLDELADGIDPETALRRAFRYSYRTLELAVAEFIENG